MLLSLVVTNLMIDSTGILALCDLIDFEAIIETTPAKLDGDALQ